MRHINLVPAILEQIFPHFQTLFQQIVFLHFPVFKMLEDISFVILSALEIVLEQKEIAALLVRESSFPAPLVNA
jgi:hypothetical protein